MVEPGRAAGSCLPGAGPDGLLIALTVVCATVLLLVAVLRMTRRRDRRRTQTRRRPRHAASGADVTAAVTIGEIQDRLHREEVQARRERPRPPRKVQVLPRIPGSSPPGQSPPSAYCTEADDTAPLG